MVVWGFPHAGKPQAAQLQGPRIPFDVEAVAEMNDDLFDPYEQALMWSDSDVGIIVTADEQMHLVAITHRVVTDCVGTPADTFTARAGLVFWFGPADSSPAVNRMATLNLLAAAAMSARVVPLLHGPVLITGVDRAGKLLGLSKAQVELLESGSSPNWWARTVLQARLHCSLQRRRRAVGWRVRGAV